MSKEPVLGCNASTGKALNASPILRDVFCQCLKDGEGVAAIVGGYVYIDMEPVRHFIMTDLDGLFRLQREIAEAIEDIAKGKKLENLFPVENY